MSELNDLKSISIKEYKTKDELIQHIEALLREVGIENLRKNIFKNDRLLRLIAHHSTKDKHSEIYENIIINIDTLQDMSLGLEEAIIPIIVNLLKKAQKRLHRLLRDNIVFISQKDNSLKCDALTDLSVTELDNWLSTLTDEYIKTNIELDYNKNWSWVYKTFNRILWPTDNKAAVTAACSFSGSFLISYDSICDLKSYLLKTYYKEK